MKKFILINLIATMFVTQAFAEEKDPAVELLEQGNCIGKITACKVSHSYGNLQGVNAYFQMKIVAPSTGDVLGAFSRGANYYPQTDAGLLDMFSLGLFGGAVDAGKIAANTASIRNACNALREHYSMWLCEGAEMEAAPLVEPDQSSNKPETGGIKVPQGSHK